jgi:hypothetical protein
VPPSSLTPPALESIFVKSIRLGNVDVLNGGLHVERPISGQMQVVISSNGAVVEGRVVDAAGKPAPNSKAVIVPNAPRRHRGDLYKFISADDDGRFQLTGVSPGDYKLFGFERVEEGAWQDPEFLKLFEDRGIALRVEEGRRVTSDLKLIPAWN